MTIDDATTQFVKETAEKYQLLIAELESDSQWHQDTYTVEVQPFLIDTYPPLKV